MQIYFVNVIMNIFTSLVFTVMGYAFLSYFLGAESSLTASGLMEGDAVLLGLNQFYWIIIGFFLTFLVGVYAYIWSKKVGFKFLAALIYMVACIGAVFLLWPTKRGIDGSFYGYGHMVLMAGFIIGAILLTAQSYLQTLNERANNQQPGA